MPNRPWCNQVWIDSTVYCFCVRKIFWNFHFRLNWKRTRNLIHFGCKLPPVEEVIKLFVHYRWGFLKHKKVFVSHLFRFRIYRKTLTWAQLLFNIGIKTFVDSIVRINSCCINGKNVMRVFMSSKSVEC